MRRLIWVFTVCLGPKNGRQPENDFIKLNSAFNGNPIGNCRSLCFWRHGNFYTVFWPCTLCKGQRWNIDKTIEDSAFVLTNVCCCFISKGVFCLLLLSLPNFFTHCAFKLFQILLSYIQAYVCMYVCQGATNRKVCMYVGTCMYVCQGATDRKVCVYVCLYVCSKETVAKIVVPVADDNVHPLRETLRQIKYYLERISSQQPEAAATQEPITINLLIEE